MRDPSTTSAQRIAFEVGVAETNSTLKLWIRDRGRVALPWLALSLSIALVMFIGAWLVASLMPQNDEAFVPLFASKNNQWSDAVWLLGRNGLVLLLHLLVCIAAYLARRAVPLQAQHVSGLNRWVHQHAGGAAMAAVAGLTAYSLLFQTWQLGNDLHAASLSLDMSPAGLLLRASVHGLPELTAVFLPLAACLLLGRQRQWNQLLAASALCAAIAVPMLLVSAAIEAWATHLLF